MIDKMKLKIIKKKDLKINRKIYQHMMKIKSKSRNMSSLYLKRYVKIIM